jgi:ABC-type glycerol-3-phosphate transport system substrate-binding protein
MKLTIRRLAMIVAASFVAAACSQNPTEPVAASSGALLNGGVTFGSGGRDNTAGTNTTAADSGSTAVSRGGVTFGSGG